MNTAASEQARPPGHGFAPVAIVVCSCAILAATAPSVLDAGPAGPRVGAVILPPLAMSLAAAALCPSRRLAISVILVGGIIAGPLRGLLYDPIRDGRCVRCLPSPFALMPDQHLADIAALVGGGLVTLVLVGAALATANRWAAAGAVAAGTATTAYDTPRGHLTAAAFVVAALAAGRLAVRAMRLYRNREDLALLAETMNRDQSPEQLLRDRLGDPSIRIEYPEGPPEGRPATQDADTPQTSVARVAGRPVALIHHDGPPFAVTPELALLLQRASLEAALAREVAELTASRHHLVEQADYERRALERDLHGSAARIGDT